MELRMSEDLLGHHTSERELDQHTSESEWTFPFCAIVGQESMKLALILNVIDPHIGGVLIMGDRGTCKSTAVRALADLLPAVAKVADCGFGGDPHHPNQMCGSCRRRFEAGETLPVVYQPIRVVDLPLGATEDRICGTIDIQKALTDGIKAFELGLLAKANRGLLYVDEVNLLDDHLVDVLLDSAASGFNIVEREGISIRHPARFVLAGSGNPEEGELRPQLIDRFGLHVRVETIRNVADRLKIVQNCIEYGLDPQAFNNRFAQDQRELQEKIVQARKLLPQVTISDKLLLKLAELCIALEIPGHRAELCCARASKALAAYYGRDQVSEDDLRVVIDLGVPHRLRKDPLATMDYHRRTADKTAQIFGGNGRG